ncbi:MAG: hypothetical protein FWF29_01255 [Treponema sp.]|nr:hypothetical protein [Treponema sp.]
MDAKLQAVYDEIYGIVAARAGEYAAAAEDQCAVWEGRKPKHQPLLLHCDPVSSKTWPVFTTREIHFDKDKMLVSQMKGMASAAVGGMQAVPSVRANMGCGIYPSLFPGIVSELFDDQRMPWIIKHLDKTTLQKLRPQDIKLTDEFKLGLEHMVYQAEKLKGTGAYVYPLDLQDAIDVAHLVYGDTFFYDLYDDPPFINHLLDLSCAAIELGARECLKIIPGSDKIVTHYNELAMPRRGGGMKFSEDTSTLLSPEFIAEFTIPSLERQLEFTGGGYVHFCGYNTHLLDACINTEKVRGINFGNPEKYDMEDVLRRLAKAGKVFYGGIPKKPDEELKSYFTRLCKAATDTNGCCRLLLVMHASTPEKAEEIRSVWKEVNP